MTTLFLRALTAFPLLLVAWTGSLWAQAQGACWVQRAELEAAPSYRFGASVAVSGDTLIVGNDGAVVLVRAGGDWVLQQELVPSTLLFSYRVRVDLDGDTALVSADEDGQAGARAGAVYVFRRSAGIWTEEAKLIASDAAPGDHFGNSLSLDGERAAVGTSASEAVYVFERQGTVWTETQRIPTPLNVFFGAAVSLSGSTLAIAGPRSYPSGGGISGNEAYVYVHDGSSWILQQALGSPLGPTAPDDFAVSLAVCGDRLVVGAPAFGHSVPEVAAAHVFVRTGSVWALEATLLPDPAVPSVSSFAHSVALDDQRLALGVSEWSGTNRVQVYARSASAWREEARLAPPPGSQPASFSYSVALDGDTLAAGAPSAATSSGPSAGRAYVFESDPSFAASVGFRNAGSNPVSYAASHARLGEPLRLTVLPALTGHSHALVVGFDGAGVRMLASGQALLCLDLGGNGELLNTGPRAGPIATFDLLVPYDLDLLGARICTQALHALGAPGFALSNAQDLAIGPPSGACP